MHERDAASVRNASHNAVPGHERTADTAEDP